MRRSHVATIAFLIWRSLATQRSAIQALQLNEAKLAEKEHLLRTITDNLPVLISYIDSNEVRRVISEGIAPAGEKVKIHWRNTSLFL